MSAIRFTLARTLLEAAHLLVSAHALGDVLAHSGQGARLPVGPAEQLPGSAVEELEVLPTVLEGIRRHDEFQGDCAIVPDGATLAPTATAPRVHPEEPDTEFIRAVWREASSGAAPESCVGRVAGVPYRHPQAVRALVRPGRARAPPRGLTRVGLRPAGHEAHQTLTVRHVDAEATSVLRELAANAEPSVAATQRWQNFEVVVRSAPLLVQNRWLVIARKAKRPVPRA